MSSFVRTILQIFLVIEAVLYPIIQVTWQRKQTPEWQAIPNSYCPKGSASIPLVEDSTLGFGLTRQECKAKCAALSECRLYSYGLWEKGLSDRFGGHYGKMRCQLYADCELSTFRGTTVFRKPKSLASSEKRAQLWVWMFCLLLIFLNVLTLLSGGGLLSCCISISLTLSAIGLSFGSARVSGMLPAGVVLSDQMVLVAFLNTLTLLALLCNPGQANSLMKKDGSASSILKDTSQHLDHEADKIQPMQKRETSDIVLQEDKVGLPDDSKSAKITMDLISERPPCPKKLNAKSFNGATPLRQRRFHPNPGVPKISFKSQLSEDSDFLTKITSEDLTQVDI